MLGGSHCFIESGVLDSLRQVPVLLFFFFFPELGLNELLVSFPSGSLRLSSMGQELCVIHGKPGWLSAEKPSVL